MAVSTNRFVDPDALVRTGPLIGICTAVLTATFLGVVALASGEVSGFVERFPLYVLASSVAFVAAVLVLEHAHYPGSEVLGYATGIGVGGFVVIALGIEGVTYAATSPEQVVASHLFVYLVSAAVFASGIAYWTARNWRAATGALPHQGL